jgi:putative nucleotidyltransferase with HDIG domain
MGNRVPIRFLSCFGILLGLFAAFLFILKNYYPPIFENRNELNFIFITLLGYSFATFLVTSFEDLSAFYIPFILLPLYLRSIVEKPLALLIHALNILAASLYVDAPNSFLAIQFIAGVAMLYVPMELKTVKDYTRLFLLVFGVYYLANIAFSTLVNGIADYTNWAFLIAILISFACTILLLPLVPWVDDRIGIASEFTLRRLLDEENVLLQQLAEKKPNVYLHARRVSYLASKIAKAIRANALLVRVGGLYHDIGKITSEPSLEITEKLDAEQRALMQLQHISEGVRLAQQHRLPNNVIDFIVTHHGMIPIEGVTTHYPGPLPQTKEQAILMLVNACDHSYTEGVKQNIEDTVQYLIQHEQFEKSNLSFHELEQCKEMLLNETFS